MSKDKYIQKQTFMQNDKKSWSPLIYIIIKELIMVGLIIYMSTQWKTVGDTGGNFGLAIGLGIFFLPLAILLDVLTFVEGHRASWRIGSTISIVILSAIINCAAFAFLPQIIKPLF